jgi:4-amino-4-deoxy-L-arabinose transferase-like glycosyltransferase
MPDRGAAALARDALPFALFAGAVAVVLVVLAMLRPVDHDESQYVAAASLTARGLLPYRDYAYLQTPLQPFLLAPLARAAGVWAWPALRIANALFAGMTVIAVAGAAMAAGAPRRVALSAAALFATTDILLFSAGTARNDALPAALLGGALWIAIRAERRGSGYGAAAWVGLLLAAATATKLSYALPAGFYWLAALTDRRRRPVAVTLGALPLVVFLAWTWWLSPAGYAFDVFRFPVEAPAEYYRATDRAWRLANWAKVIDALKFLALGPALLAVLAISWERLRRPPDMLGWMMLAGLLAALLPSPTWRQYWLPLLPPLFIALALLWTRQPPSRAVRIAVAVFVVAGLAPSVAALADGPGLWRAMAESRAVGKALDRAGVAPNVPVATLSPQLLPAAGRTPDPRFATGPFYFRSAGLLDRAQEQAFALVSRARLPAAAPAAILVGGENRWSAGDPELDLAMQRWAVASGLRRVDVPRSRMRLFVR